MIDTKAGERGRVLVTGASGFIGTALLPLLAERGFEVLNYDKAPPLEPTQARWWTEGDILDERRLQDVASEFGPRHVIHLAARTDLDGKTAEDYRENTTGTRNVLEVAQSSGFVERVVVASTMYVVRRGYRATRDDDYEVDTVYGQSKVETEEITRKGDWQFRWAIVRPAVIWGPYHMRLKSEFFRIVSTGLYFHPGKTRTRRSYGYVENTAWQMVRLLEVDQPEMAGKTFYLADPPLDLYEWVNAFSRELRGGGVRSVPLWVLRIIARSGDLLKAMGIKAPLTSFRLENMINDWTVDVGPIERVAGSVPVPMEEGVRRTVGWLRRQQ